MSLLSALLRKVKAFEQCNGGRQDWCLKLRQMQLFRDMDDAHFSELCARMEALPCGAGDVIIREGEEGDFYYVIVSGAARVTRKAPGAAVPPVPDALEWSSPHHSTAAAATSDASAAVTLADLDAGCGFGEEALISNAKRNATVTMTADGTLMRLAKHDFDELLKERRLRWLTPSEALAAVAGGARWIDVRPQGDRRATGTLSNSLLLPVQDVRKRAGKLLDASTLYICYCDYGRISAVAAFLLRQAGFNVAVLLGGISRMP